MKHIFVPEDFFEVDLEIAYPEARKWIAKTANEKLNKLIESWPVVYGSNDKSPTVLFVDKPSIVTHTARLAFVEEIPKKPCKHEPLVTVEIKGHYVSGFSYFQNELHRARCKHCGVELVATWSEKK